MTKNLSATGSRKEPKNRGDFKFSSNIAIKKIGDGGSGKSPSGSVGQKFMIGHGPGNIKFYQIKWGYNDWNQADSKNCQTIGDVINFPFIGFIALHYSFLFHSF